MVIQYLIVCICLYNSIHQSFHINALPSKQSLIMLVKESYVSFFFSFETLYITDDETFLNQQPRIFFIYRSLMYIWITSYSLLILLVLTKTTWKLIRYTPFVFSWLTFSTHRALQSSRAILLVVILKQNTLWYSNKILYKCNVYVYVQLLSYIKKRIKLLL